MVAALTRYVLWNPVDATAMKNVTLAMTVVVIYLL